MPFHYIVFLLCKIAWLERVVVIKSRGHEFDCFPASELVVICGGLTVHCVVCVCVHGELVLQVDYV